MPFASSVLSRRPRLGPGQILCVITLSVCCGVVLYLLLSDAIFFVLHFAVADERIDLVTEQNLRREKFHQGDVKIPDRTPFRWLQIKRTYDLLNDLRDGKENRMTLYQNCVSLPVLDRLRIPECRAEWMYYLENGDVVGIESMMGLALGKLAGFEVVLKDGRHAMYKPCGGPNEYPENEVRTSHIDHALGFNRAPVSISRNFSVSIFKEIATAQKNQMLAPSLDHKLLVLDQMDVSCSDNGMFYGTMIGWVDGLGSTKTIEKRLSRTSFNAIRDYRNNNEPNYVAEVFQNHFMFYLLDIIRGVGKNEYTLPNGALMTVDLDRARWKETVGNNPTELSVCYLCKVKESTLQLIQEAAEDFSLALTTRHSLLYDQGFLTLTQEEQQVMQKRLQLFLSQCVNACFDKYSQKDVIIP